MSYLFIDTCAGAGVALVNSEKPSDVLVKVLSGADCPAQTQGQTPRWIVSLMDARRHEVYAGLFKPGLTDGRLTQCGTDWVGPASLLEGVAQGWDRDFAGFADEGVFLVGNAATQVTGQTVEVRFADLARAANSLVNGADGDSEGQRELASLSTEPQYLRRPDIQQKP